MKTVHILNLAAGQGKAAKFKELEGAYVTKAPGDATEFIKKTLENAYQDILFKVYGGDGTVNEAVCGVISSGSDKGIISVVPVGTGNDLVRSIKGEGEIKADVLTMNGRYAINAINTGFDLEVVQKAAEFKKKPLVSGTLAYILGVVSVFTKKFGKNMRIEYIDKDGKQNIFDGECLLTVAANGSYYGGGFKASPAADLTDGYIDLMIIKKVSRLRFISVIGQYKKGTHIDAKTGRVADKFKDIVTFCKCKAVKISGIKEICADGEVFETEQAEIGVLPGALRIKAGAKEVAFV